MAKVEVTVGIRSGVGAGLAKIRGQFSDFRRALNSDIGQLFAGAALLTSLNAIREELDRVQKLGIRFGETAENIQRVSEVAKMDGSDIEQVAGAVTKVSVAALKAVRDGGNFAELFKSFGIDAAGFLAMPLPEKLITLSAAYAQAKNSGEGLARMQELLGKTGAELIPMLARGPDELRAGFESAYVASQSVVDSTAAFNDSLEKVGMAGKVAFGFILQLLTSIAKVTGVVIGTSIGLWSTMFDYLKSSWTQVASVAKAAMAGNLSEIGNIIKQGPSIAKETLDKIKAVYQGGWESMREELEAIWNPPIQVSQPNGDLSAAEQALDAEAADARKKADEEALKRAEEIAKLKEQLATAELERLLKLMSTEERINRLVADRKKLLEEAKASTDEKEKLELQLKAEKVMQGIDQAIKSQADEQKQLAQDLSTKQERLSTAQRNNAYEALSTEAEKFKFLEAELALLDKAAKTEKDPLKKLDLQIQREEKAGEVSKQANAVRRQELERVKNIVGDSMTEIGGGGNVSTVGASLDPVVSEVKTTNQWLQQIYEQNKSGSNGSSASSPLMKE